MYDSIKGWLNLNVIIHPFIKRTGTGSKVYGDSISTRCYAVGELHVVKNNKGEEVTSNTQLYFDGSENIKVTDKITFDGNDYEIQSISTFYRDGKSDLKVVYL